METRLAVAEYAEPMSHAAAPTRLRAAAVVRPRFAFVTYAVEIEGDAPLWFFAEAVDD
jgi:hypothetical protein